MRKIYVVVLILILAVGANMKGMDSSAYEYDDEFDVNGNPIETEPDPVSFMDSQGLTYDNSLEEDGYISADVKLGDQEKVSGKIVVPATIKDKQTGINYKVVSAIGPFNLCTRITSVVLPATWDEISFRCFYGCTSLRSVTMKAKTIKSVDTMAFAGCKKLITIKNINKVKIIENQAFEGCSSLKKINLDSVTNIGSKAFKNCIQLKQVSIGKNVKSLSKNLFSGCKKLKKITIRSAKLKKVDRKIFSGTSHRIIVKVPKKKLEEYKKLFKNKGNKKIVVSAL